MTDLLQSIHRPEDIKRLSLSELYSLASEIRAFMVETVSETGGHLAPSLGTVELTLALYHVFDLEKDKLIWDVGHQAYTHKILSGRKEKFHTLRQLGGITGFPNRFESKYDAFGVGHASTAISAALGMAIARDLNGGKENIIAVIGDGALTGGEAFEALNHAGDLGKRLIVILNDNGRSISENVGAVSEYLARIRLAPEYHKAKKDVEHLLKSIPRFGDRMLKTASVIKDGVRTALVPGSLFEEFGFQYVGPLNGHDIHQMIASFNKIKELNGPVLVHIHTKKGKGYAPAEREPEKFHGIGRFDIATGDCPACADGPTYTEVFSQAMLSLAAQDRDVVAITAAMPKGTGLQAFGEKYPDRYFDVGIAEEHAMTLAAGLAAAGKKPFLALYSTFAQRAYDQMLHDVCLQKLPVRLCLDRAGLVGADGPTHHGVFDFSYLRHIPNMVMMAPKNGAEFREMLFFMRSYDVGPISVRYPKGTAAEGEEGEKSQKIELGKAEVISSHGQIALLAVGSMVAPAEMTKKILEDKGLSVRLANMRFIKPLDTTLLMNWEHDQEVKLFVTMEENALAGGFGAAVLECLSDQQATTPVLRFGIPDRFIAQGKREELLKHCGLLAPEMSAAIFKRWKEISQ